MTDTVTQAEFARLQSWSRSHVTGLKHAGRLVMTEDGKKVLVAASLERIEATRDPNREDVAARHAAGRNGEPEMDRPPPPARPPASGGNERASTTYQQSRAVKERYLALQAKAHYEKDIGKLIDVDVAKKAGFDLGALLRTSLENLQDQLSAELAPETDPAKIYTVLGEHFEHALSDISRKLKQTLSNTSEVRHVE